MPIKYDIACARFLPLLEIGCKREKSKAIFPGFSSLEPIEHSKQSERLERLNFVNLESSIHRIVRTLAQDLQVNLRASLYRIVTRNIRHDY